MSGRTTNSASKVLKVLLALRGHALNGLSNGELSKALGEPPSAITRHLSTLVAEGLAVKLPSGRYAHGVMMLQIATAYASEMNRAQSRIDELKQRVLAGSHQ